MESTMLIEAGDGLPLAVSLSQTDAGSGGPPLLMIPGLGASRHVYEPLVPLLARRLPVAVFDPRGVGESGKSERPVTLSRLAADAADVLDGLGWGRAAVFGASMGGMVAQHLALDHPERVWRLLLACTGPGAPHAVPAERGVTRALLGKGESTAEGAYRMATTVLYEPAWAAAHPEFVEAEIAYRAAHPVRGGAFSNQYEAVKRHDAWDRLPSIAAPTLVLHGTADTVMPPGNGERLAGRIPGARFLALEGRGHLFWHEDPEAAAAAITGFLLGGDVGRAVAPQF